MRVFVHHDAQGKVRSLVTFNAPQGVTLMLTPRAGDLVAEVDAHGLTTTDPADRAIRDLARNYKVAVPVPKCTLVKKA